VRGGDARRARKTSPATAIIRGSGYPLEIAREDPVVRSRGSSCGQEPRGTALRLRFLQDHEIGLSALSSRLITRCAEIREIWEIWEIAVTESK